MQVRISLSQLVHVPVNCQTFRRMVKSNWLPSGTKRLPEQPKSMIVVGSGAIGVEFAYSIQV